MKYSLSNAAACLLSEASESSMETQPKSTTLEKCWQAGMTCQQSWHNVTTARAQAEKVILVSISG